MRLDGHPAVPASFFDRPVMDQATDFQGQAHTEVTTFSWLLQTSWRARWWIIALAALGAATGLGLAAVAKRTYRAEAVVMPISAREREPLEAIAGSLGGLASLAGISGQGDSGTRLALATLRGKQFTATFIHDKNLMPILYPDRWDASKGQWKGPPPTTLQAVDRFDRGGIRKIIEDRKTGLIIIQIDWNDRLQAVDWLNSMIAQVNMQLRDQAIAESRRSIQFLTSEGERNPSLAVKEAIYRLMETQMKQLTFAEGREDYAFKFVDRAITPDPRDFIWPRRLFMTCLGGLAGGILGGLVSVALESRRRSMHA